MKDNTSSFNTDNITICIDSRDKDEFAGRLFLAESAPERSFADSVEMLKILQLFFESNAREKMASSLRSFSKKPSAPESVVPQAAQSPCGEPKGSVATFALSLSYMQNTTWQGVIKWKEKDRSLPFRSALEMILLLGEAAKKA